MNCETLQFSFSYTCEDSTLIECCLEDLVFSIWYPADAVVTGIFDRKDQAAIVDRLTRLYDHLNKPFPAIEFFQPDQTDWLAEQYMSLPPIEVESFFIYSPHHGCKVPDGKVGLEIESSHAFGSGHHPTTSTCLKALQELFYNDDKLEKCLDVGCGSGILALSMASLWKEAIVIGCDCDPKSVQTALNNANNNRRLRFILSDGMSHSTIQELAPYHLIAANIHSEILIEMSPRIMQSLAPQGWVLLSGMLETQAQSVVETYVRHGGHLEKTYSSDQWMTLLFRTRSNR